MSSSVWGGWRPGKPLHLPESKEHRCGWLWSLITTGPVCSPRAACLPAGLSLRQQAEKPLPFRNQHLTTGSNASPFGESAIRSHYHPGKDPSPGKIRAWACFRGPQGKWWQLSVFPAQGLSRVSLGNDLEFSGWLMGSEAEQRVWEVASG